MRKIHKDAIYYLVKARAVDRHNIMRLVNKTFDGYAIKYDSDSFLTDVIWIHLLVKDNLVTVTATNNKVNLNNHPDVTLEVYQDIEGIPLMHPAIMASRNHKE